MDLAKEVKVEYKDGKLMVSALDGKLALSLEVSAIAKPVLMGLKAKIDSGEIDLIKGTDIDKMVADKVIEAAIAAVG